MYKKLFLCLACGLVFGALFAFSTQSRFLSKDTQISAVAVRTPILSAQDRTPIAREEIVTRVQIKGDRTIEFNVPVSEESVDLSINIIRNLNIKSSDPIFLILNSPGGEVDAGRRLMSVIQGSKAPVTAVIDGLCASMCTYIFNSAKHRYMVHGSTLMYHQASGQLHGEFGKMKSRILYWTEQMDEMNAAVADRAGVSRKEFLAKIQNEYWLSSDKALSLHFSDGTVFIDITK